jgi:cell division septum initiation protein DivIVA
MSVIIYQEHCEMLEKENEDLKKEILFLKEQLRYKTLGHDHGIDRFQRKYRTR